VDITSLNARVDIAVGGVLLDLIAWPTGDAIRTAGDVPPETLTHLAILAGPVVAQDRAYTSPIRPTPGDRLVGAWCLDSNIYKRLYMVFYSSVLAGRGNALSDIGKREAVL
jgi:hypothetical protein